ncbi:Lysophosphatidic acid acyltransferase LPAAT [Trachipleistophora hominis]|uniref:Lysophosphatidic acid acyltransferase LPAAT n=1 Tax=Trachipleistophora hominis TaxID=72359 RepID=L7JZF0_TRAHO|nr:Lysophosphatidic acid acyltransferase LPAAT [Trachipleistophora hominis]
MTMLLFNALKKYVVIPLASIVYITSVTVGFVVCGFLKLILPFPGIRQKIVAWQKCEWLHLTIAYGCIFFPHPVYVAYNKQILQKKRCLVISNHQTNYDWLIILIVLQKFDMYRDVCILVKSSLAQIPIFGSAMKAFGYVFIKRSWSEDLNTLKKSLNYLHTKSKLFFLIFPEGTILVPSTHSKSITYSQKMNVKLRDTSFSPQNVLIPRTSGTNMIYNELKDTMEGIIDVTLFVRPYYQYPQKTFTYTDVYFRNVGKIGFFFLVDFMNNVTSKDWLYEIFEKKEILIEKYKQSCQLFKSIEDVNDFTKKFAKIKSGNYDFIEITLIRHRNLLYLLYFTVWTIGMIYLVSMAAKWLLY